MDVKEPGKRIMVISRDFLCSLLTHGLHSYSVVGGGIPKDAVVTGMSEHVYFKADKIAIRLESCEWQPIPDGARIPELPGDHVQECAIMTNLGMTRGVVTMSKAKDDRSAVGTPDDRCRRDSQAWV